VAAFVALVAVSLLALAPAHAADAPKAKTDKKAKTEAKAAPAKTEKAAAPKAAKAPKAPKPKAEPKPKAPEKSYEEQRAEDGPWAKRTNWLSFRAGYARNSDAKAGDAVGGYGFGYQRMLNKKWSFGASVQHDVLGHLGASQEIAVPFTVEFQRHYHWKTVMRPYVGFGGGYYFHKYYRTGDDTGAPGAGYFIGFGSNVPIDEKHLLGVDARVSFVNGRDGVHNAVFGDEKASMTFWSVKLNWAMAY
jgi:hypothetical protein